MKLFTMYIGLEKDSHGQPINAANRKLAIHLLKDKLITSFGGYSAGHVKGGYTAHNGMTMEEDVLRVEVTTADDQMPQIQECAAMFRNAFRQESILLNCTTIESEFI